MNLPNVVHPTRFRIKGIMIEVVSYGPLTNEQAAKVAQMFYLSRKFTKQDQGRLFQTLTTLDSDSAKAL